MGEPYNSTDEKCLLLAYYFGRIKLLNCVALHRITKDLIKACELNADNHGTSKYSEPLDGCCLCEEKEILFKELLQKHGQGSQLPEGNKIDLEKAWTDVSKLWRYNVGKNNELNLNNWSQDAAQACQNLIKKHGLKVFGDQECSHILFLSHWESLIKSIKKKIKACCQSISTINGSATMPSNPGPNVTKWTMRNAYFFLVKKKSARQHAKFMQSLRKVGIQIRAAREPVSVLTRFTMCTLCTQMGNKHKVLEIPKLLKKGLSYLSSPITIDDDPDIEPIFGGDDGVKRTIVKMCEKSNTKHEVWLPVKKEVTPSENGAILATVRRSDRTPVVKKKNESFLYYANTSITNVDSTANGIVKKRRASLPVFIPSMSQTVTASTESPATTICNVNKPNPNSIGDSLNVVIVTADGGQLETTVTSKKKTPAISSQNVKLSGPNMSRVKIVPVTTMSGFMRTINISPLTMVASTAPQSGMSQVVNTIGVKQPQSPFTFNSNPQMKGNFAPDEILRQSYRAYSKPTVGSSGRKKAPEIIPITPTSLAQLINSQKSQRVFFFPANSAPSAGIELKKPSTLPLALSQSQIPSPRSRSISLDSGQQKKVIVQNLKRETPAVTTSTVKKMLTSPPKKSPLFVQIVNGRIQKPGGVKPGMSSMVKSIPLSGNHVKFVKSVSLKSDGGKLVPTLMKSDASTGTMKKTLVLGGNLKQGSIMRVGPSPTKHYRSSTNPRFQLGKSFTFKTVNTSNEDGRSTDGIISKKHVISNNAPLPHESQSTIIPTSTASKKSNPSYLHSPLRTPGKKKHTRPPSKSMATVVAEHIFSLMPSSADEDLWKKLNTKNKRRSEKSSALIPVPYETNFLCIHDTIERFGWKAYWYWRCRCSKVREKAAETDPEYSEPNPADIAAWVPGKVTDAMRKTLTNYVESEDRVPSTSISPPKDKSGSVVRVLLEDCYPKSDHEQKDQHQRENDESENIDVETVEDAAESSLNRKRKSSEGSSEKGKKTSIGIIAKYRKDKNGNWTAMSNFSQVEGSLKSESEVETLSQSSLDSTPIGGDESQEDSVMLNIQPGLNSSGSSVAMEDRVGTTNDHGLRRCARVTMIRRKALVRRALDAEMRFKVKRERAENSASEIFLCSSFRYGSLTDPNFSVITAHPLCFREEQDVYLKVSSAQDKRHQSRQELLHAKVSDEVQLQPSSNTEDSIISLLSSPTCPTIKEKLRKTQLRDFNPGGSKTKLSNNPIKSEEKVNTVTIRNKNPLESTAASSLSKSVDSSESWNLSNRNCKVVNQVTQDVAFSNLQVLRGIPATQSPTNVISRWNAEFVTRALQGLNDKPHNLNPVVVLPVPTFTLALKNVKKEVISEPPEKPESPPAKSLPLWMTPGGSSTGKVKSSKTKNRHVVAKVAVAAYRPSESASSSVSLAAKHSSVQSHMKEKQLARSVSEANLDTIESMDDNCLEISIQKVYSLSTQNPSDYDISHNAMKGKTPSDENETNRSPVDSKMSLKTADTSTISGAEVGDSRRVNDHSISHDAEKSNIVQSQNAHCGMQKMKSVMRTEKPSEVSSENAKNFIISDCGLDEVKEDAANESDLRKVDLEGISEKKDVLKSKENGNSEQRNELQVNKVRKFSKPEESLTSGGGKKPTNFVPSLFTIHRDLRTMLKMSKRGSLAHLSLSGTKEDSIPFKKHLRRKFKGNRNLATLLGRNYDLKRVASQFNDQIKGSNKRLPVRDAKSGTKPAKVKRKKSTRQRPLSNMFNWIWDANDVENAKLAKYMPVATNGKPAVNQESVSRESTPETIRGTLLSKMANSAAKLKDLLPGEDMGVCPSPQAEEAGTPSEVSEVQLLEPSPSSPSSQTSPRQQRKRRPEGSHSLDGMYWTDLMDYDGADQQYGKNLRRRRILSDENRIVNKERVNKRKRQGVGLLISSFDHTGDILNVDKESVKKCNGEKSTIEWEDEDTDCSDPLQSLFSRALNVERLRLWIWDSTTPRPMQLLRQEQRRWRKGTGLVGHRNTLHRANSLTVESSYSQVIDEIDCRNTNRRNSLTDGCFPGSVEGCLPEAKHATIPLIRCSVPPEDSDSDSERPTEKRLFLVRRKTKKGKGACTTRPKGLSKHRLLKNKPNFDFKAFFAKVKKHKFRDMKEQEFLNSLLEDGRPQHDAATATLESEVVVDVDEGRKSVEVKLEPGLEYNPDVAHGNFCGPFCDDDIVVDNDVPERRNRYCPSKKSHSRPTESDAASAKVPKKRKRRSDATPGDAGETKLQALRETVFMELKQKGNFKDKNSTPESSNSGSSSERLDRRRPLLQSRCSTKGTFISRLLECDTECILPNDVVKT